MLNWVEPSTHRAGFPADTAVILSKTHVESFAEFMAWG